MHDELDPARSEALRVPRSEHGGEVRVENDCGASRPRLQGPARRSTGATGRSVHLDQSAGREQYR